MNQFQRVVMIELVGGPFDGRQCALSADEDGPAVRSLPMEVPRHPMDMTNEPPPVLVYECATAPEHPTEDVWLFRLVGQGPG